MTKKSKKRAQKPPPSEDPFKAPRHLGFGLYAVEGRHLGYGLEAVGGTHLGFGLRRVGR